MENKSTTVPIDGAQLEADLTIPEGADSLVLFIHGTGSSKESPRNRHVAEALRNAGIATLLLDLLTMEEKEKEAGTGEPQLDMSSLSERVIQTTDWCKNNPDTATMKLGLFGASTGAAAALIAATSRPEKVGAVVSRGGRPDLVEDVLPLVKTPTLFIAGERDSPVVSISKQAIARMETETKLEIVPGATHLFEEPGALDRVSELTADWFKRHLATPK